MNNTINSNLFSQFNTSYLPVKQNIAVTQNTTAVQNKKDTQKQKFNYKNLLIPTATTAIGGVGGYSAAKFQEKDKFERLKQESGEYEKILSGSLHEKEVVKVLLKRTTEAQKLLDKSEKDLASLNEMLAETDVPSEIYEINKYIKRAKEKRESIEKTLKQCNEGMATLYKEGVTNIIEGYVNKETQNIKNRKNKFAIYSAIVGFVVGLGTILINKIIKNKKSDK